MKRLLLAAGRSPPSRPPPSAPAGATNECRGLNPCVPVAGPWVVVPVGHGASRPQVQYQLTCPTRLRRRRHRRGAERPGDRRLVPRHLREPRQPGRHDVPVGRLRRLLRRRRRAAPDLPPACGVRSRDRRRAADADGRRRRLPARSRRSSGACRTVRVDSTTRIVVACQERRAARRLVLGPRLRHRGAALPRARRRASRPGARTHGDSVVVDARAKARPRHRPGRGSLRRWAMTFGHPLLLLTLLVVPAAVALYVCLDRRPARYAMTFTNLDVLASVVPGRSIRRYVPAAARAARARRRSASRSRARTAARSIPSDHSTVILVHRRLRLDARDRRQADPARRGAGGGAEVPRQGARPASGSG